MAEAPTAAAAAPMVVAAAEPKVDGNKGKLEEEEVVVVGKPSQTTSRPSLLRIDLERNTTKDGQHYRKDMNLSSKYVQLSNI